MVVASRMVQFGQSLVGAAHQSGWQITAAVLCGAVSLLIFLRLIASALKRRANIRRRLNR